MAARNVGEFFRRTAIGFLTDLHCFHCFRRHGFYTAYARRWFVGLTPCGDTTYTQEKMVTHNICIHTQVLTVDIAVSEMVHWLHTLVWHFECGVLLRTCRHVGCPVGYQHHRSFRQCTDFRVSVGVTEWQTCGGQWVCDSDRMRHIPFLSQRPGTANGWVCVKRK